MLNDLILRKYPKVMKKAGEFFVLIPKQLYKGGLN